jgi:hypothetical protein
MRLCLAVAVLQIVAASLLAQTTQGLIGGQVRDSAKGAPIAGAKIQYQSLSTNTAGIVVSGSDGYFLCPLLPPGKYRVRVEAEGRFQPQEVQELNLAVAGRVDINFALRPIADVFGAAQYRSVMLARSESIVTFFGPDVDMSRAASFESVKGISGALETSLSQVIDPQQVKELPFGGRDLYTMLVTQPGVSADTATSRGLGLSVNGQRPTSSNFLLDGVENNNYTITGPLTVIAPEAMQEYRVSTNNFSAEYGRASGFVANAVTKSGGNQWHGIGYFNLRNSGLNANEFQFNRLGLPRAPLEEWQPGFQIGGPIRKDRIFTSTAFEYLYNSSASPQPLTLQVPAANFAQLFPLAAPNARRLMQTYPSPSTQTSNNPIVSINVAQPQNQRRVLALQRLDWLPGGGKQRLTGRFSYSRLERPDFIWSPYKDFVSALEQPHQGVAANYQANYRPDLVNEFRAGWNRDVLQWDRANPGIPTIVASGVSLPGSPASYAYRNRNRTIELSDSVLWSKGRHVMKFGGGLFSRGLDGELTFGRDAAVFFPSILEFAADQPVIYAVALKRQDLPNRFTPVNFERQFRYNQFFLFAQDTFKVTSRLGLNFGVRYESFGSPRNTGPNKEAIVRLGQGGNFAERLRGSSVDFGASGEQELFGADRGNFGARFGFSYALRSDGRTLLRGAIGTFFDRPFDNLWQNLRSNSLTLGYFLTDFGQRLDYLAGVSSVLGGFTGQRPDTSFPNLAFVDGNYRNPTVQSYLFGVQHQLSDELSLEVHSLGSLSRHLTTTDIVNRSFSVPFSSTNFNGRYNPNLPEMNYLASQGSSNYHALAVSARWRGRRHQLHATYTWSHSIDNQSDPLIGDFFDLGFTRVTASASERLQSTFSQQFNSSGDRGSSDFDQRHNLVIYSIWELPGTGRGFARSLTKDWRFAQTAAFRSGFPYTVYAGGRAGNGTGVIYSGRADLIGDPHQSRDVAGGVQLLNPAAFRQPAAGVQGTLGRNSFASPGIYSIDLSLARSFAAPGLRDKGRFTLRLDAFNALNHANLGTPANQFGAPGFGAAQYGRRGNPSYFPALLPFQETGRQLQVLLRFEY